MKRTILVVLAGGLIFSCAGFAQDADEDDPGRGVARIGLINGDVSMRRGDNGDWMAAAVNSPLVVYDQVATGANSRVEVQFDYATLVRLGGDSEIRLSQLENRKYQVQLGRGTAMISVVADAGSEMELDTPNVAIRPGRRAMVRVTVTLDGQSEITVREGEAEVASTKGVERVQSGQTMLVRGGQDDPEFQMARAAAWDSFDRWNQDRDQRLERSSSYQYVSRDIYGAEELDGYGRWVSVAPYGWVWTPTVVDPGWSPYSYGRWSWVDYYGWTWMSYDPWGWAPYHYGRWFHQAGYGWCWFPGPIHHRHYWSPALVAFFGFGGHSGFSIGIGFGHVGWVPLAPYEPYYRWWGRRHYQGHGNIHIVNHINIRQRYRNARVERGVHRIGAEDFVRGRAGRHASVGGAELDRASLVRGAAPLTPRAESLRVSDRQVRFERTSRVEGTRFYSRRQAAPVERISFAQQQRSMQERVQRSFGAPGGQGEGRSAEVRSGQPAVQRNEAERSRGGWRRIGEQPRTAPAQVEQRSEWRQRGDSAAPSRGDANVWRRFPQRDEQRSMPGGAGRTEDSSWRRQERSTPRQEDRSGWDRFGTRRNESAPQWRQEERSTPQYERSQPRYESPRYEAPRRSESIRINPPIVRERSGSSQSPRYERSGSSGGGSRSSGSSAPRSGSRSSGGGGRSGGRNR